MTDHRPTILLVRHGRPQLLKAFTTIKDRLQAYDQALIDPTLPPPVRLKYLAANIDKWLCSSLPRAQSSLTLLSPTAQPFLSDLFMEAPLPEIDKPRWLPLQFWLAYLRGRWMQGHYMAAESYQTSQDRAQAAAELLCTETKTTSRIALMGHGFFNHLLAEALKKKGWREIKANRGYWSTKILVLPK